jgi:type IV secretory pathway VirB2 component (pilin)
MKPTNKQMVIGLALALVFMVAPEVVLAGTGGLAKADSVLSNIITWLTHIAAAACTIVVMYKGYQVWAGTANWNDAVKVIIGAILIAGGAEISNFLFN